MIRRRCLVLPPAAKTRGKPDRAEALPIFVGEQPRGSPGNTSSKKRPRPVVVRPRDVRSIKRREPMTMTSVGQTGSRTKTRPLPRGWSRPTNRPC